MTDEQYRFGTPKCINCESFPIKTSTCKCCKWKPGKKTKYMIKDLFIPTHEYFLKILDDIRELEKQIRKSNLEILEDINEAEKKIKEYNNDKETTI